MTKDSRTTFFDKCFKDKQGRIAIGERPNLPIIVWFISAILAKIITSGKLHDMLAIIAFGAIFTWAWMELLQGTNYFRRAAGAIVMFFVIYNRLN